MKKLPSKNTNSLNSWLILKGGLCSVKSTLHVLSSSTALKISKVNRDMQAGIWSPLNGEGGGLTAEVTKRSLDEGLPTQQ